jgi:hypothetical protein
MAVRGARPPARRGQVREAPRRARRAADLSSGASGASRRLAKARARVGHRGHAT